MEVYKRLSWKQVRKALDNIYNVRSYYIGGSLCIDMNEGYSVVLNRSGRGFAFVLGEHKELGFLMPKDVQATVCRLYQEIKGNGQSSSSSPGGEFINGL